MDNQDQDELMKIATNTNWSSIYEYSLLGDLNEDGPLSLDEIVERHDASRKTVRNALRTLADFDIIILENLMAELTGFGRIIHKWQGDLFEYIGQDTLGRFGRRESDLEIFSVLRLGTLDNRSIEESCDISARTRRRFMNYYVDLGWVYQEDSQYGLTETGREGVIAYEEFISGLQNINSKSSFFRRYDGPIGCLPAEAIRDATLVDYTDETPHAVLTAFENIFDEKEDEEEIDDIRAVSPIFSPPILDLCAPAVSDGAILECVIGDKVYQTVKSPPNVSRLFEFRNYPRVHVKVYEDSLYYGLGILNDDIALIAAYEEGKANEVAIYSDDEQFVEWVKEVYIQTMAGSQTIKEFLTQKAVPSIFK